ncbi:MAG: beta-glucosidase [Ruminococcus sp.]|nr:beta-glucosidase [Ruminococcus sp.]
MRFKKDFLWGAASASYQVEGAYLEDGKGLNIWDAYTQDGGHVMHGENGNVACDHYHRFREDVAIMKSLGIKDYRLSLSWSRILPNGIGKVNEKGLQFYSDLVDELLAAGIEPLITLFHWDYPLALHHKGGWLNRESVDWFATYTKIVVDALSDRVQYWMTINEPQVFIGNGYENGSFAPFLKLPQAEVARMCHHVLLSHGKAVQVIRENAKKSPKIGFAMVTPCYTPKSEAPNDVEQARQKSFAFDSTSIAFNNAWWADPIFFGKYPEDAVQILGNKMPEILDGDMEMISQPLDFYGVNIYESRANYASKTYAENTYLGCPRTQMGWPITPEALYWSLKFLYERYGKPILITENGIAVTDWVQLDGKVHDPQRMDYMKQYLRELYRAMQNGIPVIGYTYWSIMDNFEWASGYDKRFGLVYVNYQTQERTIKDSGYFYRDVIASDGKVVFADS